MDKETHEKLVAIGDNTLETLMEAREAWIKLVGGLEEEAVLFDGEEFEETDELRERLEQRPLSVEVRSGWYCPGEDPGPAEEYCILLSTGGPAVRIVGDIGEYGEPSNARLQVQDWFLPWTEVFRADERAEESEGSDALMFFVNLFYFGE